MDDTNDHGESLVPPKEADPQTVGSEDTAPNGLDDEQQLRKDRSYTPGSEAETAAKQDAPGVPPEQTDVDTSGVRTAPGTGGPDDFGEVEVDPADLHVPRDPESRR